MARERRGAGAALLAVDGGNSKADAVLVSRAGDVLGAARAFGGMNVGRSDGVEGLARAVELASARAGHPATDGTIAPLGMYCLAGADAPLEERRIEQGLARRGWTGRNLVRNDTMAVLRAGTDRGWGVAVVCGAGMNCIGVAPDGRTARFAAIGPLSGDLAAGGEWMGLTALGCAVRAGDGRGPRTELARAVPRHFGFRDAGAVSRAIYRGRLAHERLLELPPIVFRAAGEGDAVARSIIDRLADEVVAFVGAAVRRLRLGRLDVEVVLGGGLFRAEDRPFLRRIEAGVAAAAPHALVSCLGAPPVLGAALLGLDELRGTGRAAARLRRALTERRMMSDGTRAGGSAPGRDQGV